MCGVWYYNNVPREREIYTKIICYLVSIANERLIKKLKKVLTNNFRNAIINYKIKKGLGKNYEKDFSI